MWCKCSKETAKPFSFILALDVFKTDLFRDKNQVYATDEGSICMPGNSDFIHRGTYHPKLIYTTHDNK